MYILHKVGIKSSSLDAVYKALTTRELAVIESLADTVACSVADLLLAARLDHFPLFEILE